MKKDIDPHKQCKVSPLKGAKKKLEFKQKLPLYGKTIYLDVKDARQRKRLDELLKSLGALVEKFLSKEINYVISSNTTTTLSNKSDGNERPESPSFISTPSPFNCGQTGSPNSVENNKEKTQTRAQAMVKLAQSQTQTTPVLQNAEKFGIKVIPVEAAQRWVEKECSKLPSAVPVPKQAIKKKSVFKVKSLRPPLIKFEAANLHYRPVQLELDSWPHCNVDTSAGTCPFDGTTVGRAQKTEPEYRDKVVASPHGNDSVADVSIDTPRDKTLSKGCNESSTSKLVGMQILTAGDLKRRQEKRKAVEKKRGYCECCQLKYEDIDKHLRDEDHRIFARDKNNFRRLDLVIKTVNSPAMFLKKVLHSHCVKRNNRKQKHSLEMEVRKDSHGNASKHIQKSPQKHQPITKTSAEEFKQNDIRRRVLATRHLPSCVGGAKGSLKDSNTTKCVRKFDNDGISEKIYQISPCTVVMKAIDSEPSNTKVDKVESPLKTVIKQKKLIIRNMAIGSLQVASTSPDKVMREKEGEMLTKEYNVDNDSESGISKSVYFSSDYSNSSIVSNSNPSSDDETYDSYENISKYRKTSKNTISKQDSVQDPVRQLRSHKTDNSSHFYLNKLKSAKKQLNRKAVAEKHNLPQFNKIRKVKTVDTLNISVEIDIVKSLSQPVATQIPTRVNINKLSSSSPIVKNVNTMIPAIPINMTDKCLSFSDNRGRKSRNSMEVQFHDLMILNSLSELWGKKKKKKKLILSDFVEPEQGDVGVKQDSTPVDETISTKYKNGSMKRLVLPADEKQNLDQEPAQLHVLKIENKLTLPRAKTKFIKHEECDLVASEDLSQTTAVSRIQSGKLLSDKTENDSSQVIRKITKHRHKAVILETESEKTCTSNSKISGIALLSDSQSSELRPASYFSSGRTLQRSLSVKHIDSQISSSPKQKNIKSPAIKNVSHHPTSDMFDEGSRSPVFKKSPAFRNNISNPNSNRTTLEDTPAKMKPTFDNKIVSPRSGITTTPRLHIKRQRQTNNSSLKKSGPRHSNISENAQTINSTQGHKIISKKTKRSLKLELQEMEKSSTCSEKSFNLKSKFNDFQDKNTTKFDSMDCNKKLNTCNIFNSTDDIANQLRPSDKESEWSTKKHYKLNHAWKVLSDRSISKLLESEHDSTPFLGFQEKDKESQPMSGMSYEEQSEVDLNDSYEWVIHSSADDGSDFENLVPNAFASPDKTSNSSWLNACEDYVMTSVTKNLVAKCSSTPTAESAWKTITTKHVKKSETEENTATINVTPKKLRKRKRHQSGEIPQMISEDTVYKLDNNKQTKTSRRYRPPVNYLDSEDKEIVFNFNSPQKNKREFSVFSEGTSTSSSIIRKQNCVLNQIRSKDRNYKLLKNKSTTKAKYEMKYFKKDSRVSKSNQNSSKKQLHLQRLKDLKAKHIVVPPKGPIVKS